MRVILLLVQPVAVRVVRAAAGLYNYTRARFRTRNRQRWIVVRMLGARVSHYWCGPYRSDGRGFTAELNRAYLFGSEQAARAAINGCLLGGSLEVRRVE